MKKLENKVAVVTGGAMGNGLGIVKVFLKYGAKVVILDAAKELATTLGALEKEFPESTILGYEVKKKKKKIFEEE